MGKNKRAWVHIDTVKGESSEFDSLGAVEELKDYNEDDLSNIIAETTGMPVKKRKKLKLVEEEIDSNDKVDDKKSDDSKVESSTKNKKKKIKKKRGKENATSTPDSQNEDDVKATPNGDIADKKESDMKDKKKKKQKKNKKKPQKNKEEQTDTPSNTKDDENADNEKETEENDTYDVATALDIVNQTTDKSKKKKKKKANKKKTSNDTSHDDVSKTDKDGEETNEVEEELDFLDIRDKWGNMGIPDEILKALLDKKFTDPTEIQRCCIPKGIGFKDVVGAAETGK